MNTSQFMTHGEWVMSGLTLGYLLVTLAYALISRSTLHEVKRQADNLDRTLKLQEAGMRRVHRLPVLPDRAGFGRGGRTPPAGHLSSVS
jgi:hypothetical protein